MYLENPIHDEHIYCYPNNINIWIQYSLPIIRKLAKKENEEYISFGKLRQMLDYDICKCKDELDRIRHIVVRRIEHDEKFLIIMYHIPNGKWLLLDGRHRLIEYEKFGSDDEKVPVIKADSEMISFAIINKSGYIAYCIQYNIFIMTNFSLLKWRRKLIDINTLL